MELTERRILLVDDEAALRKAVSRYLAGAGYIVEEAENGREALNAYGQRPFDLVITDIIMPDREGLQTIRDLRERFPHIPIIAVSGGGFGTATDYLDVAKEFGAARTLRKPFSLQELLAIVKDVLDNRADG